MCIYTVRVLERHRFFFCATFFVGYPVRVELRENGLRWPRRDHELYSRMIIGSIISFVWLRLCILNHSRVIGLRQLFNVLKNAVNSRFGWHAPDTRTDSALLRAHCFLAAHLSRSSSSQSAAIFCWRPWVCLAAKRCALAAITFLPMCQKWTCSSPRQWHTLCCSLNVAAQSTSPVRTNHSHSLTCRALVSSTATVRARQSRVLAQPAPVLPDYLRAIHSSAHRSMRLQLLTSSLSSNANTRAPRYCRAVRPVLNFTFTSSKAVHSDKTCRFLLFICFVFDVVAKFTVFSSIKLSFTEGFCVTVGAIRSEFASANFNSCWRVLYLLYMIMVTHRKHQALRTSVKICLLCKRIFSRMATSSSATNLLCKE